MIRVVQYLGEVKDFRGRVTGLPGWALILLLVAAAPGLVLIALSILAFLVSLLALLVLTAPVYRLLKLITGVEEAGNSAPQGTASAAGGDFATLFGLPPGSPGRKRVDATVTDATHGESS